MGTRGLTAVILDGAHRIAQYGQWDHYPSGGGVKALEFCREWLTDKERRAAFVENVRRCRFATPADKLEADAFASSIGVVNGRFNLGQSRKWRLRYPLWNRDHGVGILRVIATGKVDAGELFDGSTVVDVPTGDIVLRDSWTFAADSLFCEWAYVVDLDGNKLEVYKGFNHEPAVGRFADLPPDSDGDRYGSGPYTPVTLVATFDIDNLPEASVFLEMTDPPGRDE